MKFSLRVIIFMIICLFVSMCFLSLKVQFSFSVPISDKYNRIPPIRNDFKPVSDFVVYYGTDSQKLHTLSHHLNETHHNTISEQRDQTSKIKYILLWTWMFDQPHWINSANFKDCPINTCQVTSDRHDLNHSDAVMIHPRNIVTPHDLPQERWPHQRWVLYSTEPPYYNWMVMYRYNNMFNWTMFLRDDSDVPVSYGWTFVNNTHVLPSENLQKIHLDIKQILKSKKRLAAARISNCDSINSNRLSYIRELKQYIHLDFYGKCGDIDCWKTDCSKSMNDYKFYLAFENGYCRNYITEKFWNSYVTWRNVPVVMGTSHPDEYHEVAPAGSFINIADFSSPEHLAEYLRYLDNNDTAYEEYFSWKFDYYLERTNNWCKLCSALHNVTLPSQSYADLHNWFLEDTCDYREIFKMPYVIVKMVIILMLLAIVFIIVLIKAIVLPSDHAFM